MNEIKYKNLLMKYMTHVGLEAGDSFLNRIFRQKGDLSGISFTKRELGELRKLEKRWLGKLS